MMIRTLRVLLLTHCYNTGYTVPSEPHTPQQYVQERKGGVGGCERACEVCGPLDDGQDARVVE